jgi:TnpA family transposase
MPAPSLREASRKAALTRPIRWDVINDNYDQVIKYATAIRTGTASTEAILSRFTRAAAHPAYQAMLEIGRAQRTCFVARTSSTGTFNGRSRRG